MEFRYIGRSGLRVSPICMGTMTFGSMADKKESFAIMDKAYDAGVNFFDTAELYPIPPKSEWTGLTEEIVGEWMQSKPRESIILASKVAGAANGWFVPPNRHGLTAIDRFHIEKAIEGSLKRLKTDYIDLYQMHWPDTIVPIEESMEAFDRLVQAGKVRYLGTSNDTPYGLAKANAAAHYKGLSRFESVQNNFSLLHRRDLDGLNSALRAEQVSSLPYSPLAGGVLTGKYNAKFLPETARYADYIRSKLPRQLAQANRFVNEKTLAATARYIEIAKKYDMDVTTMSTAWSKQHDFVASTIIGATKASQLDATLAAMDLVLSSEIMRELDTVHAEIMYPMG
ncbi:MAG: aldo/keto reductase [Thiovulaceae bacterium]|nr:aldo/keto reductase [Sulfurimonadaceae bacterium]